MLQIFKHFSFQKLVSKFSNSFRFIFHPVIIYNLWIYFNERISLCYQLASIFEENKMKNYSFSVRWRFCHVCSCRFWILYHILDLKLDFNFRILSYNNISLLSELWWLVRKPQLVWNSRGACIECALQFTIFWCSFIFKNIETEQNNLDFWWNAWKSKMKFVED